MNYPDKILTVDCGMDVTAWAHWNGTPFPENGCFRCPASMRSDPYKTRSYMSHHLYKVLIHYDMWLLKVYIEGTQMYRGVIGQAAVRSGSIFELSYLVGRYEELCYSSNIDCEIINAPDWKGQMTKEQTAEKIKMINGVKYKNEHITDAVGMGFGIVGAFQWRIVK